VLALYVSFLQGTLPTIAGHLISASFLSAPAAVIMAKLIVPETGTPLTLGLNIKPHYQREENLMMAIIQGANNGVRYLVGIAALLLAFLGILALLDSVLGWFGGHLNALLGIQFEWSFRSILGYIAYPFTLILGVPPADALEVSRLIGERFVATEVTAYQHLAGLMATDALSSPRSAVIASYALCGFAHIASLAIFVGGIGAIAPDRLKDLSRLGFRALLAATLACLMTGAIAGTFITGRSLLLGF
jgi:CNT family concentrative nucleoside transporter